MYKAFPILAWLKVYILIGFSVGGIVNGYIKSPYPVQPQQNRLPGQIA
jgi:hypothetical protein